MSKTVRAVILFVLASFCASGAAARGIPRSLIPFDHPEHWPHAFESDHFVVHAASLDELAMAEEVSDDLEAAWWHHVVLSGAAAPLGDEGLAGDDDRIDVYLWAGIDTFYVDEVADNTATWWDDARTYIVLDPWGQYGGAELEANLYHELRHAIQAVDDWWEDYPIFEADATIWEARRFGFARLAVVWADYQAHADWSPFRYDGFRTWYMYGGALYFDYLSRSYFAGKLGFTHTMWQLSRNAPGAEFDVLLNEPDFADALDEILEPKGTSFADSLVAFARARWYTGARDAGFFTEGAILPQVPVKLHKRTSAKSSVKVDAMMLGTTYVTVERGASDPVELTLTVTPDVNAGAVVQTVGRGGDDARGPTRVRFGSDGRAHLAVTVVPAAGAEYDPDERSDTRYAVDLRFAR